MRRRTIKRAAFCLVTAGVMAAAPAGADTTVRVDESGDGGWVFNPDPANATGYEFTLEAASLGSGSLKAGPIGGTAAEKFIAGLGLGVPTADLASISYDFRIAASADSSDAHHFYLNVYATVEDHDKFYDCRFDYVATAGSTSSFTRAGFTSETLATNVQRHATAPIGACPVTLEGMPAGSNVRAVALNVGDTSTSDAGLVGYLDNVVVTTSAGETAYDFEVPAPVKDACKDGGWQTYNFANQGHCVSSLQASGQ